MDNLYKLVFALFFSSFAAFTACTESDNIISEEISELESRSITEEVNIPHLCGYEPNPTYRLATAVPPISVRPLSNLPKNIYLYNVYIHVIRDASNSRGISNNDKDSYCSTIMGRLNMYFVRRSIFFTLIGSEFISSNTYDQLNENSADDIFGVNAKSNAIDIYLFTNTKEQNFNSIAGEADSAPGNAFWISLNSYDRITVGHEMGHVLGLEHTFYGTKANTWLGTPELVDGSNSTIAGDYISDTPADPGLWDYPGGHYIGTNSDVDANGDIYAPDTTNIMSYYGAKRWFSDGQEAWMRTYLVDEGVNSLCLNNKENVITGSRTISTSATYSLNRNILSEYLLDWNGTTIKWTVRKEGYTGGTKKIDITNYYTTESITLTPGSECHSYKYSIQATITDYRGYTLTTPVKYAYKISNPAQTGALSWSSEYRSGSYLGSINLTNSNSSSPIKVHQGGILTFTYTDVCGADSYIDTDIFNFNIYSPAGFTKEAGSNHAFNCEQYLSTTTSGTMMLSFSYPGSSTILQIPLQVMQGSYAPLNVDSLKDEKIELTKEQERLDIP